MAKPMRIALSGIHEEVNTFAVETKDQKLHPLNDDAVYRAGGTN